MAKGGDPEAQQSINKFLNFDSVIERTNLPTRTDVQIMGCAKFASKVCFNDDKDTPFRNVYEAFSSAFMAKGGDKSKQFVEMTKQTPNLMDLKVGQDATTRSLADKLLGRNKDNA